MTEPVDPTATLTAVCPNCSAPREAGATFCEVCGLDFVSGQLPAVPPAVAAVDPGSAEWIVMVEVDPNFFATNQADDGTLSLPSDAKAREIPLRGDEILVGRTSESANLHPDVDLGSDPGVSRRHAVLHRQPDGSWAVIDQGSTNGTKVGGKAIEPGTAVPLTDGSEVHVGAWSRLTLLRAKR